MHAETCSEVLKNKEVVSCVCGSHIYNFILYVYVVYLNRVSTQSSLLKLFM
jgi:hypothetical protein